MVQPKVEPRQELPRFVVVTKLVADFLTGCEVCDFVEIDKALE